MSDETMINPALEAVMRASLDATASFDWSDDDRKWSAAGAAVKFMQAESGLSGEAAYATCMAATIHIMKEGEPTLSYCVHCHGSHDKAALASGWKCPLHPCKE